MPTPHLLPPDPSRLIEGLRDTGYDFNTALADIVDNSVDAQANYIHIRVAMDVDGDVVVSVADDGIGMNEADLLNAMTYGAKSRADLSRLGKFGLGLKTASTAFCRRLSVITRNSEAAQPIKATWDLDHVVHAVKWELLLDAPSADEIALLQQAAPNRSGTVVVWEKVDRLLKDYASPGGAAARRALQKVLDEFRFHAATVYQRFLDPEDSRARNITMTLNGEPIQAWDPFCRTYAGTELVAEKTVTVEHDDGEAEFTIRAFVLPRRDEIENSEARKAARIGNPLQGIYVYRENRLIHPSDWLEMFSKEPHYSLLRVEFSFDHRLDAAFQVDIKKSRILLKDDLYNWVLNSFLPAPRRAAEVRYRKGEKKKAQEQAQNAHSSSNIAIGAKEQDLRLAEITITNPAAGEVEVSNKLGRFRIKMPLSAYASSELAVKPVPSIDDGLLWEPAMVGTHHAVRINTGHAFYHKVYVPNLSSGVTIQGMDSLLWALVEAELGATTDQTVKHFQELRFEVSRILRNLVDELPDPVLPEAEENGNA